jgi:hypothetical protein
MKTAGSGLRPGAQRGAVFYNRRISARPQRVPVSRPTAAEASTSEIEAKWQERVQGVIIHASLHVPTMGAASKPTGPPCRR